MNEQDNNEIRLDETPNELGITSNKLYIIEDDNNNNNIILSNINNDTNDNTNNIHKSDSLKSVAPPESLTTLSEQITSNSVSSLSPINKNTLNETILTTLKRDLSEIMIKMKFVINPLSSLKQQEQHIIQWDLWGPLLFNIILSITSSFQSNSNQFVMVFALFWIGGVLVYLNGLMLGTKLSLFSYWCLLGYGLVPYVIASIPLALFKVNIVIRFIAVLLFALWAFVISMKILRRRIERKRTFLIMYPVGLFYAFFIGLLVIN